MSEWVVQAVVRATLLMGGVFLVWRWLPAARPGVRRGVILGVSVLLLVAPWWAGWWLIGPWRDGAGGGDRGGSSWVTITFVAAGCWALGSGVCLARWGRQIFRLRQVIRRACPMVVTRADQAHNAPFGGGGEAGARLRVCRSDEISGPCVAGVWRPVLLVPSAAQEWPADHWRMMLTHEGQHVRQGDLIAGWLPRLVLALYWWHPLAHWIVRKFYLESEVLCDRAAMAIRSEARAYVEFLLSLDGARVPRLAAPLARTPSLSCRIERLLAAPGRRVDGAAMAAALGLLVGAACIVLSLGTRPKSDPAPSEPEDRAMDTAIRLSASPFPASDE